MGSAVYLPVKILALKFHQSPKTVRKNINEMSKDSSFGKFVINPKEKGSPKLADLGAYAIWIEWKPQRKSYLWKTVYQPKVKELLSNLAIGTGWLLGLILVLGVGLHVFASPIRDGVHPPVYAALQTIDRDELADMRAAEEWTEPVVTPETVNVERNYTISEENVENVENFSANTTSGFTDRERYLLLHIMMHEAGNQGVIGQALVGRVVLNRVQSGRFPGSIEEVLFQPGQFGPEPEICRYEPNADSYAALELLEAGWDESQGALFFCTSSFGWATYLFSHGNHNFFI